MGILSKFALPLLLVWSLSAFTGCDKQVKANSRENQPPLAIPPRDALPPEDSVPEMDWLIAAYPDFLMGKEGRELIWRDGSRMDFTAAPAHEDLDQRIYHPTLADIYWQPYLTDTLHITPDLDPGRARPIEFYGKMYGQSKAEVMEHLETVVWLPQLIGQKLRFTGVNGAADSLRKVSQELDQLPHLKKYLVQPGGTFNWRKIAGTEVLSAHSHGIAIDINVGHSNYWRWSPEFKQGKPLKYQNRIPMEIVEIFERHGFIWGGRWWHYDTMHFEFRPEFFVPDYVSSLENSRF